MCHKGTVYGQVLLLTLAVAAAAVPGAVGQTGTDWRQVGGSAVELFLASPATGPVDRVWFSQTGSPLFARTRSGQIFRTSDFETWVQAEGSPEVPPVVSATAARTPEQNASVVTIPTRLSRIYALGRQLFRSDDGGHSWTNLTAYKSEPVIGPAQHSVAVSPEDPDQLVVANDYGVWRSMDGGRSWSGLNQSLPNLPVRHILSTPNGTAGTRIQAGRLGVLELPPGGSVWLPVSGTVTDPDAALLEKYSATVGEQITAVGVARNTVYAGSANGRIWVSVNGGAFQRSQMPVGTDGRVERIFVDPEEQVALAALSGKGPHVLRTTNRGGFWDSLDGNLPDVSAHGVTADRSAGAVYVATDKGVFWARTDLNIASTAPVTWASLSDRLPAAPAMDVRLDAAGVQLYAALDGYGVYAAAAPHGAYNLRIVSAGDYTVRPAAPGSLLSVIGGRVNTVRGGSLEYPVLAASDSESQVQVPFEAVGPSVSLSLDTARGEVRRDLSIQPVSPSILVSHEGAPMLWDAETGMPLDLRNVARANARIQIWATGLGKVRPDWPTGVKAPMQDPPVVVAAVKAFLDRSPLQVTRATLVPGYVGFYLIEVQMPAVLNAGTGELYISADGVESNRVQIATEP